MDEVSPILIQKYKRDRRAYKIARRGERRSSTNQFYVGRAASRFVMEYSWLPFVYLHLPIVWQKRMTARRRSAR